LVVVETKVGIGQQSFWVNDKRRNDKRRMNPYPL